MTTDRGAELDEIREWYKAAYRGLTRPLPAMTQEALVDGRTPGWVFELGPYPQVRTARTRIVDRDRARAVVGGPSEGWASEIVYDLLPVDRARADGRRSGAHAVMILRAHAARLLLTSRLCASERETARTVLEWEGRDNDEQSAGNLVNAIKRTCRIIGLSWPPSDADQEHLRADWRGLSRHNFVSGPGPGPDELRWCRVCSQPMSSDNHFR